MDTLQTHPAAQAAIADIDRLEVSGQWKAFFKALHGHGGLELTRFKALPPEERRAAMKTLQPPLPALAGAFVFGFFYYLYKGMWKKGLVLLAIVLSILVAIGLVLETVGAGALTNGLGVLGGFMFMYMAPRDYYSVKVLGDDGWLPARPKL